MPINFGHVYSTTNRHTENSDARLDIRRHDPDQQRRNKNQSDADDKPKFNTYDDAVVSVDALRLFLENFLKTHAASDSTDKTELPAKSFSREERPGQKTLSAQASRAASAYQNTSSNTVKNANSHIETSPEPGSGPDLQTEEIKSIYVLLRDIRILQARGIKFLTIERSDTFLMSLSIAVTNALGR
jgi:hypothetical protein